jgi:hypothetical protein
MAVSMFISKERQGNQLKGALPGPHFSDDHFPEEGSPYLRSIPVFQKLSWGPKPSSDFTVHTIQGAHSPAC